MKVAEGDGGRQKTPAQLKGVFTTPESVST
jgi:hypothetical protein